MESPAIHRRTILGAALAATPGVTFAQRLSADRSGTFSDSPLADNAVARRFKRVADDTPWPPTPMLDSGGRRALSAWRGKVVILSLWAESCPPCLVELPIMAALNARYGGAQLQIVPVITGSNRLKSLARAQKFLVDRKVGLHTLIDGGPGANELMRTAAATPEDPRGALPCNLLIDRQGRLRGRQTGYVMTFPPGVAPKTQAEMYKVGKSIWESPDADVFFKALQGGALD